jgi:membrane-associated phospholipid phosphatase
MSAPAGTPLRPALQPTTRERFVAHPRRALVVGAGLVAAVLVAALIVPTGPLALDGSWAELMNDIQTPALEHLALVLNALGHGLGRVLSIAAVGVVLLVARRWLALLAFAATESLTPAVGSVLKILVDRPRPPGGRVEPSGSSFPSGHASYAGATAVALVLLFTAPGPRRLLWWALAALGIALMAWSRTYLQVHWLSDVVAGSLLGIGISLLAFGAAQLCQRRTPYLLAPTSTAPSVLSPTSSAAANHQVLRR